MPDAGHVPMHLKTQNAAAFWLRTAGPTTPRPSMPWMALFAHTCTHTDNPGTLLAWLKVLPLARYSRRGGGEGACAPTLTAHARATYGGRVGACVAGCKKAWIWPIGDIDAGPNLVMYVHQYRRSNEVTMERRSKTTDLVTFQTLQSTFRHKLHWVCTYLHALLDSSPAIATAHRHAVPWQLGTA
jgi:hypothetical protein